MKGVHRYCSARAPILSERAILASHQQGDSLIDGIPETLAKLRALGKKMYFVTNNSTKSRAGYKKKFDSLGLDIPAEEIFSSSFAAVRIPCSCVFCAKDNAATLIYGSFF